MQAPSYLPRQPAGGAGGAVALGAAGAWTVQREWGWEVGADSRRRGSCTTRKRESSGVSQDAILPEELAMLEAGPCRAPLGLLPFLLPGGL